MIHFHIKTLSGWKYLCMPTLSVVCSRNQNQERRNHRGSQLKADPDFLGTIAQLYHLRQYKGGLFVLLCASLSTKIQPKLKGSFLLNCTSASLKAVVTAQTVQVLRWVWSRKELLWNSAFRNVFNYKTDHLHFLCCPAGLSKKWWVGGSWPRRGWQEDRL